MYVFHSNACSNNTIFLKQSSLQKGHLFRGTRFPRLLDSTFNNYLSVSLVSVCVYTILCLHIISQNINFLGDWYINIYILNGIYIIRSLFLRNAMHSSNFNLLAEVNVRDRCYIPQSRVQTIVL